MSRKTGRSRRLRLYDRGTTAYPICLMGFTRDQAASGRTVTLEHVPIKALGGQARCLTCRNCNAETGRGIDQAAAKQDWRDLENSESRSFTMGIKIPHAKAVAASSLKSAYLAMFSLLGEPGGYSHVRGDALTPIRQRIMEPLKDRAIGEYVIRAPDDVPFKDIILVSEPLSCWVLKIAGATL